MLLADMEAIRAVETGVRELSAGYDCELLWEPGTSPSGEAYDAKQTRIRANHIAVVPQARGGSTLRIGDSAMQTQDVSTMTLDAVAALPAYDWCRGRLERNGTPSERHYAMLDMMQASAAGQRVAASHDQLTHDMGEAWRSGQPDQLPSGREVAKDGRQFADLNPSEQARERMMTGLQDAWKTA